MEDGYEKCFLNPEEELFEPFAEAIWYSENKPVDCSRPNSMDRQVVAEQFALHLIPARNFPSLCSALHKAITPKAQNK